MTLILAPNGQPARPKPSDRCPNKACDGTRATRTESCGFGQPTWICAKCGYDYKEPVS